MYVSPHSVLGNHPKISEIISTYNEWLKRDGKVKAKTFHREVILPIAPEASLSGWYDFLRRFRSEDGAITEQPETGNKDVATIEDYPDNAPAALVTSVEEVKKTLLTMNEATKSVMALAMNISVQALQEMIENPESVPLAKRAELFAKVMKAQDSRVMTQVKALGQMRNDEREQQRFERMMETGAY